jgi:hypothetical protein
MTAQEALSVFDKMTYDILGSDFAEDTTYRGEILVLQSIIHNSPNRRGFCFISLLSLFL